MKKVLKIFAAIILTATCAACTGAGLSACSKSSKGKRQYGKWDESDDVKIAFVDEEAYNYGEIDESKILPELNCSKKQFNKKYYMIIDFDIQASQDNDGRDNVTAEVRLNSPSLISATIQETQSGNITENTNSYWINLSATYKIPESVETVRNIRLAIQLYPQKSGIVDVDVSFKHSGDTKGVKTESVNKSVVLGYTESLTYSGASVKSVKDKVNIDSVIIPSMHDGYYVTKIGNNAFANCRRLAGVGLPNSITDIGKNAFSSCEALTRIEIPAKVASIDEGAFSYCSALSSIWVADGNENYKGNGNCLLSKDGKTLLWGCKGGVIPNGVTAIGNSAFSGRKELTKVTIPDGVTSIGDSAFMSCEELKTVTIPDGVASIGSNAFSYCGELKSVTLPSSVTAVGDGAFAYCAKITDIALPDGVMAIGVGTFSGCAALTSVTMGGGVTSFGKSAFFNCGNLKEINFNGTRNQWDAIKKGNSWNGGMSNYVVQCTDGKLN